MKKECINSVDRSLVMIPYELLMVKLRDMELLIDKKLLVVITYILKKMIQIGDLRIVHEKLDRALERLYDIKSEVKSMDEYMDRQMCNLELRLRELDREPDLHINQSSPHFSFDKHRRRVSWLLSEYLCRRSFVKTLDLFMNSESLESLIDVTVYENFNKIKDDLFKRKLDSALKWAEDHQSKLLKVDSILLYELRLQNILIKSQHLNVKQLLKLINEHVTHDVLTRCKDAKKIITASIVYNAQEHSRLLSRERWDHIILEFERTMSKLYGFREKPILVDLIQAGFSAIKSKGCRDHKTPTCPACLPEWSSYIEQVPTLHKLQSVLICPITGTAMDYSNPPLASPDGYVISKNALKILNRSNDDYITCPKTRKSIHIADFKKIFIT